MSCINGLFVECWRFWPFSSKPRVVIELCGNGLVDHGLFNLAVDDGVVDSPITFVAIHERSNSPSPTWPWNVLLVPFDRSKCTPAKRSLYDGVGDVHFDIPVKVCLSPCFLTVSFILYGPTLARLDLECARSGAFMFSSIRAKLIGGLGFSAVFYILLTLGFCNVVFCG